jgi:hypothetical protein
MNWKKWTTLRIALTFTRSQEAIEIGVWMEKLIKRRKDSFIDAVFTLIEISIHSFQKKFLLIYFACLDSTLIMLFNRSSRSQIIVDETLSHASLVDSRLKNSNHKYLTAFWKKVIAFSYSPSCSCNLPTLLSNLVFPGLTRKPEVNNEYSSFLENKVGKGLIIRRKKR